MEEVITKVGEGYEYPLHLLPLGTVLKLPHVYHQYGKEPPPNTGPLYWMAYKSPNLKGQIKFLRRLHLDYPEFVKTVTDYMDSIFTFKADPERVNLLWTEGDVRPHVDEANRKAALNIGIMHSHSAVTWVSQSTTLMGWEHTAREYTCEDGGAYLLDTSRVHTVRAKAEGVNRLLVTYGFSRPFAEILAQRKIKNEQASANP